MNSTGSFLLHAIYFRSRYRPEDKSTRRTRRTQLRENIAPMRKFLLLTARLKRKTIVYYAIEALRNINLRKELHVSYGSDHMFL